jgi:hypothetical protein
MQTLPRIAAGFFRREEKRATEAVLLAPKPPEPTREEARILDLVDKRYSYARDAKKSRMEMWATCLAFYVGDHYRKWNPRMQRMVQHAEIPEWRVRTTDNQIPGILDTAAHKLGRSRKEPKALANTDEPEDQAAAELGTSALRYWWSTDSMDRKELEINVQRLIFGAGFFHDQWDPGKMARVPVPVGWDVDEGGEPKPKLEAKRAPVGDVTVEVLSVFDVFPEPAEDFDSITWCVVARRKPLSWFVDIFGDTGKWVQADSGGGEDVLSSFFSDATTAGTNTTPPPSGDGLATLKIYYERPSRTYPKGRHAMIASGRVLFARDTLPLPHGEIPIAMMGYRYVPKRQWPKGLVEELIGTQEELNRGQSNLAEIVRLYRSMKWLVPRTARVKEEAITSKPDIAIEYEGQIPPTIVSPPNLPAQIISYPEMQRENLRHLSGQRDLSPDGVPAGVTAASALALIDQQNNERLSTPARYGREAIQAVSTRVLRTMAERWREDRLVSTFGRDRRQQIQAFQGADIGDRDVLVDLTEGVQDTDAVRFQQLAEWFGLGVFQMMQQIPPFAEFFPTLLRDVGQEWLADDLERYGQGLVEHLQQQEQQQMEMQQAQMAQQAQMQQAQGAQAEQAAALEMEGRAAQQEMQMAQAEQQQQLAAAQAEQALAQKDEAHRQALSQTADKHRVTMAQQLAQMALQSQREQQRPKVGTGK